jgi:N-acetylglutamate synthase-like GNAT family acetyltransferase
MINQIEIRRVETADSLKIADLNHELGYQTSKTLIERQLKIIQSKSDHYVFAATIDHQVIGYIHGFIAVRLTSDTFIEIGTLIVKGNYRNKGIGRSLVNHLI